MKQIYLSANKLKIYLIIAFLTLFVVIIGIRTFNSARDQMINLANKNQIALSQNILDNFQFWVDERIVNLTRAAKFIEHLNLLNDDAKLSDFLKIFGQNAPEFDLVQLLKESGEIYVNGDKISPSADELYPRHSLIWYVETKTNNEPSVNFMPKHHTLGQATLNFCVPTRQDGSFAAALCGVVQLDSIFEKIRDFKLPPNSYSFIITHGGEILTPMSDERLKARISDKFKEMLFGDMQDEVINLGSNFIAVSQIRSLNWFVGAGVDNAKETGELLSAIGTDALVLLTAFVLMALFANFLHDFLYDKINRRKDEYEVILAHKAKMSEAGELISGINHQFIQPVNSLNLMISTLLMLEKENRLDKDTLREILSSGEHSVRLLGDTIEVFRNFYKTSESIAEFSIKQSLKNLLILMHTELSRANVSVNLTEFSDQNVRQIENIIQQILLILLHNAKDAVVEKFSDISARKVQIDVKFSDEKCMILVSEFGSGVSEEMSRKIFTEPNTTKSHGSGIGLYFGKKLANEKINGDIRLVNRASPTIFEFSFDINLKAKT